MSSDPPPGSPALIAVELLDGSRPPLRLAGPVVRLGRSPSADVVFPPDAQEVSANHAKAVELDGTLVLFDTESRNGVYVNGRRIARIQLREGDVVRLGPRGPELRLALLPGEAPPRPLTISPRETVGLPPGTQLVERPSVGEAEILGEFPIGDRPLWLGRAEGCDVRLDSLHVSAKHAMVWRASPREIRVRDLGSMNGTFVGGRRVGETTLLPGVELIIGPFFLRNTGSALLLFDTRGRTWVEGRDLELRIGEHLLLDGVSLASRPGEFIGILGPSGAGKSMLIKCLCGALRATDGEVLVNGLDFYAHHAQLKNLVGYVPQDDLIHPQLTVEETLRYAAALRLPPQLGRLAHAERVQHVLAHLELLDRRHLPARRLSFGQRKRLSIGVELLNDPNLLFLDEPTAGLDPNLEEKVMVLFRELALMGKTVWCITHTLDHVGLCDKIALLYGGRLAFFGPPDEACRYFGVERLSQAYHVLESHDPSHWKSRFAERRDRAAPTPRTPTAADSLVPPPPARSTGPGFLRQLSALCRRYARILTVDRRHTSILLLQAPVLGALIGLATRYATQGWRPTSVMFLMLSLSAFWLGCANAAREITKEAAVTRRERMVGVGVLPYVLSKLVVLQALCLIQVALLLLVVDGVGPPRQLAGEPPVAVILGGVPGSYGLALLNLHLTALCGVGLGLIISSIAGNSDKAMSLVPLALLPQILFAGALAVPKAHSFGRIAGYLVSVSWSFDLFRRQIACTHEELWSRPAPECLVAFDPNRPGDVASHVLAPGREIVLLVKDGVYGVGTDLAVMAGMVALFFACVALLQWRKKTV